MKYMYCQFGMSPLNRSDSDPGWSLPLFVCNYENVKSFMDFFLCVYEIIFSVFI